MTCPVGVGLPESEFVEVTDAVRTTADPYCDGSNEEASVVTVELGVNGNSFAAPIVRNVLGDDWFAYSVAIQSAERFPDETRTSSTDPVIAQQALTVGIPPILNSGVKIFTVPS